MITVIGAGAIGMLMSAYLTEAGFQVQLVTRTQEQAEQLNQRGLTLKIGAEEFHYPVTASTALEGTTGSQLYIIAVKSYDLKQMDSQLSKIDVHSPLLFIQNGLSHLEYAKNIPHHHIAFGSIEHGALKVDGHTVSHTGIGMFRLTVYRGDESCFSLLLQANRKTFPIGMEADTERVLLRKAILNSLINPLTAILQVKNGDLLKPDSLQLLHTMHTEMMTAFPEMKESVPFEAVIDLCKRTAQNHSSMLADRLAGRKTEIEAITGTLLRMAEQRNVELPSVKVLHSLMRALEEGGIQSD